MFVTHREERLRARNRRIVWILLVGGFIAASIGIVAFLKLSPLFRITEIIPTLNGEASPQEARVLGSATLVIAQRFPGIFIGPDNFLAWPEEIRIEAPLFQTLSVERDWANHTLILRGSRLPFFGIWCSGGEARQEECVWFDSSGIVLGEAPNTEGSLVLKVSEKDPRTLKAHDAVLPEEGFKNIITLYDFFLHNTISLRAIEFVPAKREIHLESSSVRVIASSSFTIPTTTIAFLEDLLRSGKFMRSEYVDLTVPGRAYVK